MNDNSAIKQVLMLAALMAAVTVAAFFAGGVQACAWSAAAGGIAVTSFSAITYSRHKELKRLAAEIDEVLHNGRRISFSDCREGDISILRNELEKLVANLARLTDMLAKDKVALADSLADISHQIKTPLTAISLMLPMIEREDDPVARKHAVRNLETMLEQVSWLVSTLLKIAKADAGALNMDIKPVKATDVIERAIKPLELSLDIHGLTVIQDVPDSITVECDALWMAEAIENIVKNCMEHTNPGGMLTIRAEEDALAAKIIIADTGEGISKDDLPHIFDRFYRGAHGASHEGFGIGLSLAHSLVVSQNATVRVSSQPGAGAKFEIAFPKLLV